MEFLRRPLPPTAQGSNPPKSETQFAGDDNSTVSCTSDIVVVFRCFHVSSGHQRGRVVFRDTPHSSPQRANRSCLPAHQQRSLTRWNLLLTLEIALFPPFIGLLKTIHNMPSKCNWTQAKQNRRAYQNGSLPHWQDGWSYDPRDHPQCSDSAKNRRSPDQTYVIECPETEPLQIRLRSAKEGEDRNEYAQKITKLQMFLTNPPVNVKVLAEGIPYLSANEIRTGWMILLNLAKGANPQTLRIQAVNGTLTLVGVWKRPDFEFSSITSFN